MERAADTRSPGKAAKTAPKRGRRLLLKAAAWALAVPVLGAVVVAGGAIPLYLLLPEAEPALERVAQTAEASVPATQPKPPAAPVEVVPAPFEVEVAETGEAIDEGVTGATSADPSPDESGPAATGAGPLAEDGAAPPETRVASVVPTPRPIGPKPYTPPAPPAAREVAAVEAAPPKPAAAPREKIRGEADRAPASLAGRRTVVRTAARLRASPQGAEIGVLKVGSAVTVGRCDRWCEVEADGRRGYVYASLIGESAGRGATRREDARREAARERRDDLRAERPRYRPRDDDRRFYERIERRDRGWIYDDGDLPPEEPDWFIEDEGPYTDGPPALLYYEEPYR